MILSRKHEYSVGHIRCAFAITTKQGQDKELFFLFYLVAYLSSYHEKAINALYELA